VTIEEFREQNEMDRTGPDGIGSDWSVVAGAERIGRDRTVKERR